MLKNIPSILSPELLKILSEMGHGDEVVIGDGNFPAIGLNKNVIRLDGHGTVDILKAILTVFPLDTYADYNVFLMSVVSGDNTQTPIWEDYDKILFSQEGENVRIKNVERFDFYEQTKKAFAVIATSEDTLYANIIIKKGVIK